MLNIPARAADATCDSLRRVLLSRSAALWIGTNGRKDGLSGLDVMTLTVLSPEFAIQTCLPSNAIERGAPPAWYVPILAPSVARRRVNALSFELQIQMHALLEA